MKGTELYLFRKLLMCYTLTSHIFANPIIRLCHIRIITNSQKISMTTQSYNNLNNQLRTLFCRTITYLFRTYSTVNYIVL